MNRFHLLMLATITAAAATGSLLFAAKGADEPVSPFSPSSPICYTESTCSSSAVSNTMTPWGRA